MNADAKKRYKDIDFPITCPITNREFNSSRGLSVYVTKTLKMEHSEYYDMYINHRDSSCFFCGKKGLFISIAKGYRNLCDGEDCIKKSFNSHSVEGFMYRKNCNREEAEVLFDIENKRQLGERIKTQNKLRKIDKDWDKKRSRNCKEFWMLKGYSEDESVIKAKEVMDEIHNKTFKMFKDNPDKYASKYTTKKEYYLNKGYSDEESKFLLSERQSTFSLEKCIEKYGDVEGNKIWLDRQRKWMITMDSKSEEEKIEISRKKLFNNTGYSKISQELFWLVYENYKNNKINFEELNGEVIRYDKINKRHYRYDYVDFTKKKVIEYNGDFWHCNPNDYKSEHVHIITNKKAKDIWELDIIKENWMIQRGFEVLVIWDSEYRKNPQQIVEKCIEFLNK